MKVKCIDNRDVEKALKVGKIYNCKEKSLYQIAVEIDGIYYTFNKQRFEYIPEHDDKQDMVHHPDHYNKGIEVIKYITSWEMDFLEGNIIKYVTRYKDKNGLEDLKKAKQYLEWLIEREENKNV